MATAKKATEPLEKPVRRVVPGAPPPAPAKATNKKKKGAGSKDGPAKIPDATAASLIEKAPENPKQVANGLQVSEADLAEQAERQTALAAVKAMGNGNQSTSTSIAASSDTAAASTPAQRVIEQKIQELTRSKGKAASDSQLNQLKDLLKDVQAAEKQSSDSASVEDKISAAKTQPELNAKARLVLLLQFLHLFNLFHPNPARPPTFAPSQVMPPALQMSTGQQVAALGKLFDDLANGPLEGGHGDALEILSNLESGSKQEVLPDVTFETVRSMILKLTAPPAEASNDRLAPDSGLDGPPKDFVPAETDNVSKSGPVSFIQASEIIDQAKEEPEGGQSDPVPVAEADPSKKGEQGGAGIVPGSQASTTGKADGSAAAAVSEPVNTKEIATEGKKVVAPAPAKDAPKLNWADVADDDDDDLGEAPVFEPISSIATPVVETPSPAVPAAAEPDSHSNRIPDGPTAGRGNDGASQAPPKEKKAKGSNGTGANGRNTSRNGGANGAASATGTTPASKAVKVQPKVDEDGFILQESKRTRYMQQKQLQQQQQRGGGRGGSRSGGGRGGRGGGQQQNRTGGGRGGQAGEGNAAGSTGRSQQ